MQVLNFRCLATKLPSIIPSKSFYGYQISKERGIVDQSSIVSSAEAIRQSDSLIFQENYLFEDC